MNMYVYFIHVYSRWEGTKVACYKRTIIMAPRLFIEFHTFMLIYICMHNIVTMALLMSNVNGDFKMGIKQEDDFKL